MEPAVSGGDDVIGVGFPDEWLRVVGIVFADEAVDGGLKIDNGMEDAVLEPAPGEFGEEALDGVEPGAGCWGEMDSGQGANNARSIVRGPKSERI